MGKLVQVQVLSPAQVCEYGKYASGQVGLTGLTILLDSARLAEVRVELVCEFVLLVENLLDRPGRVRRTLARGGWWRASPGSPQLRVPQDVHYGSRLRRHLLFQLATTTDQTSIAPHKRIALEDRRIL